MKKRKGILPPLHILLFMILLMIWAFISFNPVVLILLLMAFYGVELILNYPEQKKETAGDQNGTLLDPSINTP
jgi:hypothetical protein